VIMDRAGVSTMRGGSVAVVKQRRGIRPIPMPRNPRQGHQHDPRAPRSTPVARRRPNHGAKRSATAAPFFPPLCAQNLTPQGADGSSSGDGTRAQCAFIPPEPAESESWLCSSGRRGRSSALCARAVGSAHGANFSRGRRPGERGPTWRRPAAAEAQGAFGSTKSRPSWSDSTTRTDHGRNGAGPLGETGLTPGAHTAVSSYQRWHGTEAIVRGERGAAAARVGPRDSEGLRARVREAGLWAPRVSVFSTHWAERARETSPCWAEMVFAGPNRIPSLFFFLF
jgi:hypothetical protein